MPRHYSHSGLSTIPFLTQSSWGGRGKVFVQIFIRYRVQER